MRNRLQSNAATNEHPTHEPSREPPMTHSGGEMVVRRMSGVHLRVDDERKRVFLKELARTGSEVAAARKASPHAKGVNGGVSSFDRARNQDPEFAAACEVAKQHALAGIETEIYRRAMEPARRPVWHRGELVGYAEDRNSSDKLLLRIAERLDSTWSQRSIIDQKVEVTGKILNIRPEDILLLAQPKQVVLIDLLREIADARGEGSNELSTLPGGGGDGSTP
jgi:hypothetical protein